MNDRAVVPDSLDALRAVSPALAHYSQATLADDVWKRPELPVRDRSLVTVAALVARRQLADMPQHIDLALDNGVTPAELSELVTHLAFYAGWPSAVAAAAVIGPVFVRRHVQASGLPPATGPLLPLDEKAEEQRATQVGNNFGATAPGVVQFTTESLFRDLWLRPGLAPRDRSLVTVTALVSSGQVAQIPYHLGRAMDNGLSQPQASEMLTQLAFYAGWPNVFSAMPVFKDVFEKRAS